MPAISIDPRTGAEPVAPPPNPATAGALIHAPVPPAFGEILTPAAVTFVADLARRFERRRRELLARRADRQRAFDAGAFPALLNSTAEIRQAEWRRRRIAPHMTDRRGESTGP